MNILIIGGNCGSSLLATLLLEDETVKIYHYGAHINATATDRYIPLNTTPNLGVNEERAELLGFLDTLEIDLVIPTAVIYMLWKDLQDKVKSKKIPFLGTTREIAMLEWSKISGKKLLKKLGIPTPDHKIYNLETLIKEFPNIKRPFVFKYDKDDRIGLQTVIVTDDNYQEEYELLKTSGNTRFGNWGDILGGLYFDANFVVESFVEGVREYSYHAICNGVNWQYLGSARDYKKRFDGDVGFNTVGIGAYSGVETNPVVHTYVNTILNHLKETGQEWVGIMYLGILEDKNGIPHVLEINTRFGNPEMQVLLPTIETNLKDLFYTVATNQKINTIDFKNKSAVVVRVIHQEYQHRDLTLEFTNPIFTASKDVHVIFPMYRNLFNASIIALADSVNEASDKIYNYLKGIDTKDFTYRTDIGYLK